MVSLKFVAFVSIFSVTVSYVCGQLAPGSNTYLPPTKGYSYPSPPPGRPSIPTPPPRVPRPPGPPPINKPPGGRQPGPGEPGHVHMPGNPFDFEYAVNDRETSNDYSHKAASDGDVTTGEYRVQLPDGRTQIVRYTADWKTGFHADVSYEGEPQYPQGPTGGRPQGGYKY